jgi:hypothetical protein
MFETMGPERLDDVATGVGLAGVLAQMAPADLGDEVLLSAAVAAHRQVAWAQSQLMGTLAELQRRCLAAFPLPPPGKRPLCDAGDEFSAAAAVAPGTASNLADLAQYLDEEVPRCMAALAAGDMDLTKAKVVMEVTVSLSPQVRRRVEDVAVEHCRTSTPRQLRARLEREAVAADPEAAAERHEQAKQRRYVTQYAEPDGMGTLVVNGTAVQTETIFSVLDARARSPRAEGDTRTLDQRRMDALFDIVTGATRREGGRPRVEVQVVVGMDTLLGGNDLPALLRGYGPITSEAAREIAKDARWRRLVTDSMDGTLLDVGTTTYRPPKRLERFVKTRDLTCVHVSCARDSRTCDLDHNINYPDGPTAECNLAPGCERHHNGKTHCGWALEQVEPGVFVWTSRLGRRYEVDRRPYLEFTPEPAWPQVPPGPGRPTAAPDETAPVEQDQVEDEPPPF